MFKNLRPLRGGKSKGKVPFMKLLDTSKYFNERRTEMGFTLPEISQLEMLRFSRLVRLVNPTGKVRRLLSERSRTLSFGKTLSRTRLVNLLVDRLST